MADPMVIRTCIRAMWATHRPGTKLEDDVEQTVLANLGPLLVSYSDDAVKLAAQEWMGTSVFFPKPVEFVDVVRRHHTIEDFDRKALGSGMAPEQSYPVGKAGSEGLAAGIVIRRMFREVAKVSPKGYLGRWAGLSGDVHPGPSMEEMGHTITAEGHAEDCERCWLLAAVAYEEAVKFADSALSKESWMADSPPGLRRCRNETCERGWVSVSMMEQGRLVARVAKCPTCGGPQPAKARVEPKEGDGTVVVKRRRRRSG